MESRVPEFDWQCPTSQEQYPREHPWQFPQEPFALGQAQTPPTMDSGYASDPPPSRVSSPSNLSPGPPGPPWNAIYDVVAAPTQLPSPQLTPARESKARRRRIPGSEAPTDCKKSACAPCKKAKAKCTRGSVCDRCAARGLPCYSTTNTEAPAEAVSDKTTSSSIPASGATDEPDKPPLSAGPDSTDRGPEPSPETSAQVSATTDAEIVEDISREASASGSDGESGGPRSERQDLPRLHSRESPGGFPRLARRVGLAQLRIELLSFSRGSGHDDEHGREFSVTPPPENRTPSTERTSTDTEDASEATGNEPATSNSDRHGQPVYDTGSPGSGPGVPGRALGSEREGSDPNGNGGDRGRGRKRKRRDFHDIQDPTARFACPYQVHETWRDCLQRGPRNPKGGCVDMQRLKQHLSRRHMASSRCHTCWVSFDSKAKRADHVQSGGCREKPRPELERFMDAEHESQVEQLSGPMSEETWWKLFRLLIPGMQSQELAWLKARYYPYYISGDFSLSIPSLNFDNVLISQLPEVRDDTFEVSQENRSSNPDDRHPNSTGLQQAASHIFSQTLSVPVFESARGSSQDFLCTNLTFPQPDWSFSTPQTGTSSTSSNPLSTPLSSNPTQQSSPFARPESVNAENDNTQLRRNIERLKERNRRADSQITALHDANRESLHNIRRADSVLEELMSNADVPGSVYESLAQISKILEGAAETLRRGS